MTNACFHREISERLFRFLNRNYHTPKRWYDSLNGWHDSLNEDQLYTILGLEPKVLGSLERWLTPLDRRGAVEFHWFHT
jgi:hypothetical protein